MQFRLCCASYFNMKFLVTSRHIESNTLVTSRNICMNPNKEYHQEEYVPCFRGHFAAKHGDKQGHTLETSINMASHLLVTSRHIVSF